MPHTGRLRKLHLARGLLVCLVAALCAVVITYRTVPDHRGNLTHFDTIIVLGTPSNPDGSPSAEQRTRVLEAVRELRAGRADTLIVTGGETLPGQVEADAMARVAGESGVAPGSILRERQALNTLQNIFYSHQIMQQHGWSSAEVVSSRSHLPRASLILEHWDFDWRVHPAPWPPHFTLRRTAPYYIYEALGTTALRWFGFRRSPFLPTLTP